MSEGQETQPFGRNTCYICGGTDFEWGRLLGRHYTSFLSDEQARKILGEVFGRQKVRVRKCNTCQNIQLFGARNK